MGRYVAARTAQALIPIIGVFVVVFVLLRASGDPVSLYLPVEATAEQREQVRMLLGLDQSLPVQLVRYLGGVVQGDLGTSIRFRRPAAGLLIERIPATFTLAVAGMGLAIGGAVVLGGLAASRKGKLLDDILFGGAILGQSTPSFWFGILLILIFAVQLHWLPTSGSGGWRHLILPSLTVASFQFPQLMLLVRSGLLAVAHEEYIRTARSKGLSEHFILLRHSFPNVLNPVVTSIGVEFGRLLGGAVITEYIFNWPGVGQLAMQAVFNRDFPIVQAATMFFAVVIISCNLAAEIVNAALDPRIRRG
jgi:ABC-type dipeptide/oligopeptide/nickel transport system permease component